MQGIRYRWLLTLIAAGTLLALQACGSTNDAGAAPTAELAVVESGPSGPISEGGVTPIIVDEPGPGGNVTCEQLGYAFSSERVNFGGDGFDADFPDGITVEVTDGTYVAWSSTFGIDAVIVKGSNAANVYEYDPASLGDTGLAAPLNASGGPAGLSNLTFCWDEMPQEEEEEEPELKVTKTAHTTFQRSWDWTVDKIEKYETTVLRIPTGGRATAYYQLTIGLELLDESGWMVTGDIVIDNVSDVPATITDISDVMTGDIEADVDCGADFELPYVLGAGETLECSYASALPDATQRANTVTVTLEGGAEFLAMAPVAFDEATNELPFACVEVYDNFGTGDVGVLDDYEYLGYVCFDEEDGLSIEYLTGKADAVKDDDVVVFTYEIEIGSDGTPVGTTSASIAPTCEPGDREFTNTAKIRFADGTYVTDSWTIDVIEIDSCSNPN